MRTMNKRGQVANIVIGVFLTVLVVAAFVGMTFLFILQLKNQVTTAPGQRSGDTTIRNETLLTLDPIIGESLAVVNYSEVVCSVVTVANSSSGVTVAAGNYTVSGCQVKSVTSASYNNSNVNVTYTYSTVDTTAYKTLNSTEKSGADTVNYVPLVFLALIFGAILTVVVKILIPLIAGKSQLIE